MTENAPAPTLEEAVIDCLEHYGQPQTAAAVVRELSGDEPHFHCLQQPAFITVRFPADADVAGTLASLAEAGKIKEVHGGVHSDGSPTLEYAPLSFAVPT